MDFLRFLSFACRERDGDTDLAYGKNARDHDLMTFERLLFLA